MVASRSAAGSRMGRVTLCLLIFSCVSARFTKDGCPEGWLLFQKYCYSFTAASTDFDVAKGICISKGATLASLWRQEEYNFVKDRLQKILYSKRNVAWIGLEPDEQLKSWIWLDGSSFNAAKVDKKFSIGKCGVMNWDGTLGFKNCQNRVTAFVCKTPLKMLYLPSTYNITEDLLTLDNDPSNLLFERLRPPLLDKIFLDDTAAIAVVDVSHETDCAYRCYNVDDCRGFILKCLSTEMCYTFSCALISNVKKRGNS